MTTADSEALVARAAAAGAPLKRSYVRTMFSEIAPRYDLLNHVLSFGIDRSWRRRALARLGWERRPAGTYLDLCAGTLDVAASLSRRPGFGGQIIGADFAEPMLRAGRGKARPDMVAPVVADALILPLANESCDGAIVAFGIRNVAGLPAALTEVHRVLACGGRFVILEFSTPRLAPARTLYLLYLRRVLPLIGRLVSGHPTAYRYLPESVRTFPDSAELAAAMSAAGFRNISWNVLSLGIAAIHVGEKPGMSSP
ncbi:MAG TPA: ubiquinone/menaquinone biosynthesis methyltransferase [Gemmatimonadaceae bacterium]|nr:ubiquinone/menaquinone biosynthesis methyltransferase [Gemmatimonadaceae bacterium]